MLNLLMNMWRMEGIAYEVQKMAADIGKMSVEGNEKCDEKDPEKGKEKGK